MGRETNKNRRQNQAASAREKAAASRALQKQQEQRKRAMAILSTVVVIALVAVGIGAYVLTHKSKDHSKATAAATSVLSNVTNVSAATVNTVGAGTSAVSMQTINNPPLTVGGKPDFLFVGAEFCPFCAAERWSMIQALSRFGTFTGLKEITSHEDSLPTFDFVGSSYTSKYVSFSPIELEDQNSKPLQKISTAQNALFTKYAKGAFPFLYIDGKYYQSGAGYDPTELTGLTQAKIAANLNDPTNSLTKSIVGEANSITAAICGATGGQPANVCTASGVNGIATKFKASTV